MFDNFSPFSESVEVQFNEDEIDNEQIHPDFILRAADAVESSLAEGKRKAPFSLSHPAQDAVSQYNVRVNGNVYSLGLSKWKGVFKLMEHELENTSTLVKAGDIEIIEQDFTIEMEDYLADEGFDVEFDEDGNITGPDGDEAKEFIEEKFGV